MVTQLNISTKHTDMTNNKKQTAVKKVLVFTIKAVLFLTVGIICKLLIAMFDDYNAAFKNGWH
jgi:hypothetical protein